MKPLLVLLTFSIVVPSFAASAKMSSIVLYQPDSVMKERVRDVATLTAFIQQIQSVCTKSFTSEESEGVDVVVVLKPGGRSRVWFVSSLAKTPDRSMLKSAIEALRPPAVSGPVVFALVYDLNGFAHPQQEPGKFQPPIPAEWTESVKSVKGPLMLPDGFIPYAWPDEKKC